jgi:hypothetical protein
MIPHPPQIHEYAVRHGTRLRFVCNAAFNAGITFQNLLDTMLVATSAIVGYDQFFAVKIRGVEVWATPALGTAVDVSVIFDAAVVGQIGDQRLHTDTSMGIEPAHVKCKPSPKSLASDFQLSTANIAMFLSCPAGAVVDVELTFVQSAAAQSVEALNALVGATVGAPYWRGLDGVAAATSKFTPVAPAVI